MFVTKIFLYIFFRNSQPIISPPQIEAVEFEEYDYDEDDNGVIIAGPPAPPPTMVCSYIN